MGSYLFELRTSPTFTGTGRLVRNLFFHVLGDVLDGFAARFDVFSDAFDSVAGSDEWRIGDGQQGNQNLLHESLSFSSKRFMITLPF